MALADILDVTPVEVGKIKIGRGVASQGQNGAYRRPEKLDHFWISTLHRDERTGDLMPDAPLMKSLREFADKDGKLRAIPVMFGDDDVNQVMTSHYVWYVGRRLAARSDGQEVTFWADPSTGKFLAQPETRRWDKRYLDQLDPTDKQKKRKLFKLYSTLNVMIASGAARYGGYYRLRTTSEISSRQLYGSIVHLQKLTCGVLRGLVFRLVVRPMQVNPNGQAATVYVVHVEYVSSDLKSLQTAARLQLEADNANLTALKANREAYRALVAHTPEPDDGDLGDAGAESQQQWEDDLIAAVRRALAEAKTLQALAETWQLLNKDVQELPESKRAPLVAEKDARKAALARAAAPATPPPAEQIPDAEAAPVAPPAPPAEQPKPAEAPAGSAGQAPAEFSDAAKQLAADKKRFFETLEQAGVPWMDHVQACNAAFGTRYPDDVKYSQVEHRHLWFIAERAIDLLSSQA